ncbi:MAG: two pore domain potassium channel family protein [Bacteroidetes bacterium]|nr:MAG: two pore domain potassium channel family protein [Bacteroidota bacterium]
MSKRILALLIFFTFTLHAQDADAPRYSFTEFFNLIDEENDTIFELSNAVIYSNNETDSAYFMSINSLALDMLTEIPLAPLPTTKTINKHLVLNQVYFEDLKFNWSYESFAILKNIHFKKSLSLNDTHGIKFYACRFDGKFDLDYSNNQSSSYKSVHVIRNTFNNSVSIVSNNENSELHPEMQLSIVSNRFNFNEDNSLRIEDDHTIIYTLYVAANIVSGGRFTTINIISPENFELNYNEFKSKAIHLNISIGDIAPKELRIIENKFHSYVSFFLANPVPSLDIGWKQFRNKLVTPNGYLRYSQELLRGMSLEEWKKIDVSHKDRYKFYINHYRVENEKAYDTEMSSYGTLYNFYKEKFNKRNANEVYIELKDLETQRLEHLYHTKPSTSGFFKWKMNQFLKVFSDYGTNPTKSIIFSMYVILLFGAIYLFFPNSWDYHGKYRIVHRYGFLMQYMTRTANIQDIYLERRQCDFEEHHKFEAVIAESNNKVPKFFTFSAQLLNKWAKADSLVVAFLLKRVDVLKGKWVELSKGKKRWKAVLLITMLVIGIIYDIFIKVLNALMLSINTFTTLGFGEIPIKGLPRYLAIVQGFIGWFLLTIFSVSLISQLME